MRLKKDSIVVFVVIGAIFGYPLVAGISATLGLPNSIISLLLRAAVALASLILILSNLKYSPTGLGRLLFYCTFMFIVLYVLRLVYSTALSPEMLSSVALNYWIWAVGSAFLPVLALSLAKPYNLNWPDFQKKTLLVVFIASILVALNMSSTVTTGIEIYDSGRARLETLNPISLGHLGASLFILSIAGFWRQYGERGRHALLPLLGVIIGVFLVIASNSRGPIVSAAAALFFALLMLRGKQKAKIGIIVIATVFAFVPVLQWVEIEFGFTTYSRLFGQSFSEETNVVARLDLYLAALKAFLISPVFGAGLEVEEVGFYPHNVTLEAFLAVGIFGGLLFLSIQLTTLVLAWNLSRVRKDLVWVSMITVQYMTAAQFSGALYASPSLWAVIGITAFASRVTEGQNRRALAKRESPHV